MTYQINRPRPEMPWAKVSGLCVTSGANRHLISLRAGTLMPMHESPTITDEPGLLSRLRNREEAAFDELIDAAAGRMLSVARKMMPTEADAEDAVQDAFLSAFKSLDRFDGRSKLTTWLHQITVNACLMKLRSKRRRPEKSMDALLPEFMADGHQKEPQKRWHAEATGGIEQQELRALGSRSCQSSTGSCWCCGMWKVSTQKNRRRCLE
jgi:RNA polymerase sigma-70 factor (ECF subfamily)